ncbi:MAG: transcription-repair coupling factor, partial [Acidobacteria bacterium]|nr:transcription-repair coupling factor [Acidobacteriota bacterium]
MILPDVAEILRRVGRHPAVEDAIESLRRGARKESLGGLTDSARALVIAHAAIELGRPTLVLVDSNQRAEMLSETVQFFYQALGGRSTARVETLPSFDVLPWQGQSPHPEIAEARAVALWRCSTQQVAVLIAPLAACRGRFQDAEFYSQLAKPLVKEQEVSHDELILFLAGAGYERTVLVEMPGQYSVRGGIVDVFSPEAMRPVRIELLGDNIESIREFDPATQRSVLPIGQTTLLPLCEIPRTAALLDELYSRGNMPEASAVPTETLHAGAFPGWEFAAAKLRPAGGDVFSVAKDAVLFIDEPASIEESSRRLEEQIAKQAETSENLDTEEHCANPFFFSVAEFAEKLETVQSLRVERLPLEGVDAKPNRIVATQTTPRYHGNVPAFMAEVRGRALAGESIIISAANTGELERLADLCHEFEIPYQLGEREGDATMTRLAVDSSAGSVPALTLLKAPLQEGVIFPELRLGIYGNTDIFETIPARERRGRRAQTAGFFSDLSDLRAGDYVVHVDHGIGQFEGLREIETDGATNEFMLLRYAEEARVYLPLARLDLLQKYTSLGGTTPALDRLGGMAWTARKTRARKAVAEMAEKLLKLYAERKSVPGHAFPADVPWQREFEDSFEFEETPDQVKAISDIKRDMERPVPMDRLLCGDVGYGKTEVAMRAAFKAVCDGKQVAILAPT